MRKILLTTVYIFFGFFCSGQIDTNTIFRVAKLKLVLKLGIGLSNHARLNSCLAIPLKLLPLKSDGFVNYIVCKIEHQVLAIDTIDSNKYALLETPPSYLVDSPYTNSLIVAIAFNGDIWCLGGCHEYSDIEELAQYENWIYKMKNHRRRYLEAINYKYHVSGYRYVYVGRKIALISSNKD
jgi:hypothetical protein